MASPPTATRAVDRREAFLEQVAQPVAGPMTLQKRPEPGPMTLKI